MTVLSAFDVNRAFGVKLRTLRDRARLSQIQLAERSKVGRTTIANMEAGAQAASIFQIFALATAMGVSPHELLPDLSSYAESDVDRMMRTRAAILGS